MNPWRYTVLLSLVVVHLRMAECLLGKSVPSELITNFEIVNLLFNFTGLPFYLSLSIQLFGFVDNLVAKNFYSFFGLNLIPN